jgi:hypothetical protein
MSVFLQGVSCNRAQYFTQVIVANGVYAGELVYRHVFKTLPQKRAESVLVDQADYDRIISTSCCTRHV